MIASLMWGGKSGHVLSLLRSMVAGNARRACIVRDASRDALSESKRIPTCRNSQVGNNLGETAKFLPACKTVSRRLCAFTGAQSRREESHELGGNIRPR